MIEAKIRVTPPLSVRTKNGVTLITWADRLVTRHEQVDVWVESKRKVRRQIWRRAESKVKP
jgi:hypothetical protein